jgi:hypothetical protein
MSRWAYPACLALADCSPHGSKNDAEEVAALRFEEEQDDMAEMADGPLIVRAAKKKPKPKSSSSSTLPSDFIVKCHNSVFHADWPMAYAASDTWKDTWQECHASDTSTPWPLGVQLRGNQKQFMYKDGRLCVPESLALPLVKEWHENALGHVGKDKMAKDLNTRFIVGNLNDLISKVRSGCQLCQACEKPNWSGIGQWRSTHIPDRPMAHIALDILSMPLAKTWDGRDVDAALVVVDRHTGLVFAFPHLKKGFTSKMAAQMVHHHWFDVFGVPCTITSDLGPHFSGTWWRTLCALKGVHHASAVSYRPMSNGRAERHCGQVLEKLRLLHQEGALSWCEALPRALQLLHDVPGPAGVSPYFALFGRDRLQEHLPMPVEHECEDAVAFAERMSHLDGKLKETLDNIHQQREKEQHASTSFCAGDLCWVIRPRPLGADKTSTWWIGPCPVVQRLSDHTYTVQISPTSTRDCHIAQLKRHFPSADGTSWPLHFSRDSPTEPDAAVGD